MARKVKAALQPVTVNPEKIVRGLTTVFQGFSVMFDGMAEQMQLMQDMTDQLSFPGAAPAVDTQKEDEAETSEAGHSDVDTTTVEAESQDVEPAKATDTVQEEDTPPWEEPKQQDDTKPDASAKEKPAVSITQADLTKVIVSKIKLKRDNNAKIGKLLSAYGVSLLSDLPEDKYEAFLNDLSQL